MIITCDVCGRERFDIRMTHVPAIGWMCKNDPACKADLTRPFAWADAPVDTVTISRAALDDIIAVLRYVSRGRGNVNINYDYPDALARKTLTVLEQTA